MSERVLAERVVALVERLAQVVVLALPPVALRLRVVSSSCLFLSCFWFEKFETFEMFETLGKLNLSNPSNLSNPLLNWRGIGLEPLQHSRPRWFCAPRVVGRRPSFRPVVKDQCPLRGNPCGFGLGRVPDSVTLSARNHMSPHLQRAKTSFTPISRLDCGGDSSIPPNVYRPQKNLSLFSGRGKTRTQEAPSCASRGA